MAKKRTNWESLAKQLTSKDPAIKASAEAKLTLENKALIIKKKDILRKYNEKYGTSYKLDVSTLNLKDVDLHKKLEGITTKNLKGKNTEQVYSDTAKIVAPKYSINGVVLSADAYKEMKELEAKANKLRGYKHYKGYFTTARGYSEYIKVLRKVSTQEGYLEGIKNGLLTFLANTQDHLAQLIDIEHDADKIAEYKELADWIDSYWDTYARLDKAYKFFKSKGYTAEQMARLFFDSDDKRRQFNAGEDITFITILKEIRKRYGWKSAGRITNLELKYPMTFKQQELARQRDL